MAVASVLGTFRSIRDNDASEEIRQQDITERVAQTFGPNECVRLRFLNKDTGDEFLTNCDLKRCTECGPRKQMIVWLQTVELLGDVAWIGRVTDSLDQDLARIKKRHQRSQTPYFYVVAGNIIISNIQISDSQRFMELKPWRKRFITEYMFAYTKLRRSRAFGRLSLVTLKRKGQTGTSAWQMVRRVFETPHQRELKLRIDEELSFLDAVGVDERDYLTEWEVHTYVKDRASYIR